MLEDKPTTWEWRAGYDYATEKYKAEIDRLRHDIERMQEIDSEHLAEIDRLRAENADLAGMLKLYFHAHETGNSLPPYIVTQARAILAKTASHQPAFDQEQQKSG